MEEGQQAGDGEATAGALLGGLTKLGLQALAPVNLLLAGSHKKLCDGLKSVL
jgi:hypothetical protein